MIKNNKIKLIISSVGILLQIFFGLIFWNKLPEQMATHWGADGTTDGSSNKSLAVFLLPVIILAVHWICILFTVKDAKNKDQNKKVFGLVLWMCPMVSLYTSVIIYATALVKNPPIVLISLLIFGLLFIIVGNYLPKCKQNYTIGLKFKWTLQSEENWNATHRFGGKVWVIGGILIVLCALLPKAAIVWALVPIFAALVIVPLVYSYVYYRKQKDKEDVEFTAITKNKTTGRITIISMIFVAVILIFVGFLMFTGDINMEYNENSFVINASYWSDITVDYAAIESVEYRTKDDVGIRVSGLGSARLLAGAFENDEFGSYTRYSYISCNSCVVLNVEGKILIINGLDDKSTKAIYNQLIKMKNFK